MSDLVDPAAGTSPPDPPDRPAAAADISVTAIGVVGAALGFWLTHCYVRTRGAIVDLYNESSAAADLDVWLILLSSVGALAAAIGLLSIMWLIDLAKRSSALAPRTILIWSITTGGAIAALIASVIWVSGESETGVLNGDVAGATRAITVGVAVFSLPSLLYFAALHMVARDGDWLGDGSGRVARLFLLRRLLVRQTSLVGALLTLIVIATGLRRRTLLAIDGARPTREQEMLDIPAEQVLLYGLTFAALLWLFYFFASSELSKVSRSLVDEYAPIPDPGDVDVSGKLDLRVQVEAVIARNGSRQTFEASVVILSPLVTALIGAAIG